MIDLGVDAALNSCARCSDCVLRLAPGATVIDVGINFVDDPSKKSGKRMVGDVAFEEAMAVAGHVTPVPGGSGQ